MYSQKWHSKCSNLYQKGNPNINNSLFDICCLPCRIERLWRDVYEHAIDLFYQTFMTMENNGTLDPDNEIHLFALHWIFLPQIQKHLESFRRGWNLHGIRTERNQSPLQLWTRYRDQGPTEVFLQYNFKTFDVFLQ